MIARSRKQEYLIFGHVHGLRIVLVYTVVCFLALTKCLILPSVDSENGGDSSCASLHLGLDWGIGIAFTLNENFKNGGNFVYE